MSVSQTGAEVARVTHQMSDDDRDAAVAVLATGCRTADVPVSQSFLDAPELGLSDPWLYWGAVSLVKTGRLVNGRREKVVRPNPQIAYYGPWSYPMSYVGTVDVDRRVLRLDLTSTATRFNRVGLVLALVAGGLIGWGAYLTWYTWWSPVLTVLITMAVLLPMKWVTPRREAVMLVRDLERIAWLAQHAASREVEHPTLSRRPQ
ncbi:hypothetical protein [Nocardioides acrostichi]|uniref:Uncharacterized protein n=1 Tax=Nocardioides acrostichi TaxID=2784339 RepID=A0A930UYT0_9ACTN|nr:hypothetical protein [Nocardioides acrostichi]MBF4161545.1 hypothetical protein [Nocardioides acrostichi]